MQIIESSQMNKFTSVDLVQFLSRDSLQCDSEFQLLLCISRWLRGDDLEDRQQHAATVLQQIRLPLMSPEELLQVLGFSFLFLVFLFCTHCEGGSLLSGAAASLSPTEHRLFVAGKCVI